MARWFSSWLGSWGGDWFGKSEAAGGILPAAVAFLGGTATFTATSDQPEAEATPRRRRVYQVPFREKVALAAAISFEVLEGWFRAATPVVIRRAALFIAGGVRRRFRLRPVSILAARLSGLRSPGATAFRGTPTGLYAARTRFRLRPTLRLGAARVLRATTRVRGGGAAVRLTATLLPAPPVPVPEPTAAVPLSGAVAFRGSGGSRFRVGDPDRVRADEDLAVIAALYLQMTGRAA